MAKLSKKRIGLLSLFVALVLIVGIGAAVLNHKETQKGSKEFTVEVVSERDSFNKTETFNSDAEFLGAFLQEQDFITYTDSDYGTYINAVYDLKEDTDNQYWWCASVNGEVSSVGVDEIPIKDGDKFTLTLKQGW